jgi:hypothetical protein
MSSSQLSNGGSKEKPTGAIASCISAGTAVRNIVAAFSCHASRSTRAESGRKTLTEPMNVKMLPVNIGNR